MTQSTSVALSSAWSCFYRACGLVSQDLLALLKDQPTPALQEYVRDNQLTCDNVQSSEALCQAILSDTIHILSQLAKNLCDNIRTLERNASLARADRQTIHAILRLFRLDYAGLSDQEKCQRAADYYATYLRQVTQVVEVEKSTGHRYPRVLRALVGLGLALVVKSYVQCADPGSTALSTRPIAFESSSSAPPLLPTPSVPGPDMGSSAVCRLRLEGGNTPFDPARYFVSDDLRVEMDHLAQEPTVQAEARRIVNRSQLPGTSVQPVVTFLLGAPGAGKTSSLKTLGERHPDLQAGLSGAVVINTDDLRDAIPGYRAMLELGTLDGHLVSNDQASRHSHAPASALTALLTQEMMDQNRSMVLDRTGHNWQRLRDNMAAFRRNGYIVNAVVVVSPLEVRQARVRARAIRGGRHVGASVVQEEHSPDEWQTFLAEAPVDHFALLEN